MRVGEDIRHQKKVALAFQDAEKAFLTATEDADFYTESELQDYVGKIYQKEGKE